VPTDGRGQPCSQGRSTSHRHTGSSAQWRGRRLGDHRDDALGDARLGRGRVAARPLAGDEGLHTGRRPSRSGGGHLPGGHQVRGRRTACGRCAAHQQDPEWAAEPAPVERLHAEGTTV
ncbi:MAG: ATP synthase protein I, partial [uncultured Blastococcus sp.]